MHSNSVVFPDPFGPINPSTSPCRIDNETPATAVSRPYDFVSPPIDTMLDTMLDTIGTDIGSGKCTGGDYLLPDIVGAGSQTPPPGVWGVPWGVLAPPPPGEP